jgi:ABC-type glutathione transport system ATPase component
MTIVGSGAPLISDFSVGIREGEAVSVVGASGAGKSLLIRALLGVFDEHKLKLTGHMRVANGEAVDLSQADAATRFDLGVCGLVANPRLMLNPVITVEAYFNRVLKARNFRGRRERFAEACRLLSSVGISDAEVRMGQYPFELSGGTAQRVCIALSLAAGAKILCFDEPTAGLDVTIQRQVLDIIRELRADLGLAVIFSTSDLALASNFSDRIIVMDHGHLVEEAKAGDLYRMPQTSAAKAIVEVSRV